MRWRRVRLFRELLPDHELRAGPRPPRHPHHPEQHRVLDRPDGRCDGVLWLFRELLPDQERVLGRDHPDTLTTRGNIAYWTGETGDAMECCGYPGSCCPTRSECWVATTPARSRPATTSRVGPARRAMRWSALRLFRELPRTGSRVLGRDHPDSLSDPRQHRALDWPDGRCDGGEAGWPWELLPDQERVLGRDHPDSLRDPRATSQSWTGRDGRGDGRVAAVPGAAPGPGRVLGRDHPDTLRTGNNIAAWTGETGDARGALRLYSALLPDQERVLGRDHPDTLTIRNNIAHWTGETGDAHGARRVSRELLPDQEAGAGPRPPRLAQYPWLDWRPGPSGPATLSVAADACMTDGRSPCSRFGTKHPVTAGISFDAIQSFSRGGAGGGRSGQPRASLIAPPTAILPR